MKRYFSFIVALLCCLISASAQTNFIATLQHGESISHFYGQGAFQDAYGKASDGDIITLSPGTFNSISTFNKSITVRGTGFEAVEKTYINGDINVSSQNPETKTIFEGIYFQSPVYIRKVEGNTPGEIDFIKCLLGKLVHCYSGNSALTDNSPKACFYNCNIWCVRFEYYLLYPNSHFYNCHVADIYVASSLSENLTAFNNCLIESLTQPFSYCQSLNFRNCIFVCNNDPYKNNSGFVLQSTCTAENCLSINNSSLFKDLKYSHNNKTANSISDVFKSFTKNYHEGENYELTDDAKNKYLGADNTQIGMMGGQYPYTSIVQYPIITTFNVAPKTTKEGKLSIEVAVDGK